MCTPAASAASKLAVVLPGAMRSAPLWPTHFRGRFGTDGEAVAPASVDARRLMAAQPMPPGIGKLSWVAGRRGAAATGRPTFRNGLLALACRTPVGDAVVVALAAAGDPCAAARAGAAGLAVDALGAGRVAVAGGALHERAGDVDDRPDLVVADLRGA